MALLTQQQIQEKLKTLRDWINDGRAIVKRFRFADFQKAIEFVNQVAKVAVELKHYPNINYCSK